jgi:hypothetical protein
VASGGFEDTCLEPRFFESFLHNRFVKMMPAFRPSDAINVLTACRKKPLPAHSSLVDSQFQSFQPFQLFQSLSDEI